VRVLLCLHHNLNPDFGAPGATLALGAALEAHGLDVAYYSYDQAYGRLPVERVNHRIRFPLHVAAFLARHGDNFDVVDASTGDLWLWAGLGRPGASSELGVVTRAHGLEHVADAMARAAAHEVGPPLSWKYPLYHGSLQLWEVRRTLRLSDACILLNAGERDFAVNRLGVDPDRVAVVPNGIPDRFHVQPPPEETPADAPLRIAFIGRWSTYKGNHTLVEAAQDLHRRGVEFSISILGTLVEKTTVAADFPPAIRGHISVTPTFANHELPGLLAGHDAFVFPSLAEGASVALLEAMACGLAPIATAVGAAPEILDGSNGVLIPPGDAAAAASALERLARDRTRFLAMRRRAQQTARRYQWTDVAGTTVAVYERALAARSTASRKRGPTVSHV
jgi:glycosyltransferase involved in cell wall biosynthesis